MKKAFLLLPLFLFAACSENDQNKTTIETSEPVSTPVEITADTKADTKTEASVDVAALESVTSDTKSTQITESTAKTLDEIEPIPVTAVVATHTIATDTEEYKQTDPSQIYDINKEYKTIDTSSPEDADKSIAIIRYALSDENRRVFDESIRKIAFSMMTPENMTQEEGGKKPEVKMLEGMFKVVNGKTAEEIIQYASSI
jgi:galactitol-specific phosphotransferase system IIB component